MLSSRKNLKTLSVAIVFGSLLYNTAMACDPTDPVCVASKIYESGATFRTEGTKQYYCKDNIKTYELTVAMGKSMSKVMKERGIDYFEQSYHDFKNVHYDVKQQESNLFLVTVSGSAIAGFSGTDFETTVDANGDFFLIKDNSSGEFCFPNQLKIDALNNADNN